MPMDKDKWYITCPLMVRAHKVAREETVVIEGREVSAMVGDWIVCHTDGTNEIVSDKMFKVRFREQS